MVGNLKKNLKVAFYEEGEILPEGNFYGKLAQQYFIKAIGKNEFLRELTAFSKETNPKENSINYPLITSNFQECYSNAKGGVNSVY